MKTFQYEPGGSPNYDSLLDGGPSQAWDDLINGSVVRYSTQGFLYASGAPSTRALKDHPFLYTAIAFGSVVFPEGRGVGIGKFIIGRSAAKTESIWARDVVGHWDRGTFPNRLQSLKYHYAKHGAPGQSFKDYAAQGVKLSEQVGATGKTVRVRGRGGGIVNPLGRTYSTW